jgi:HD-GYP domain-containing protein (c-di-GMP phosphodiesterase class II)
MSFFQKTEKEEALHQIYKVAYSAAVGQLILVFMVAYQFLDIVPIDKLYLGVGVHFIIYTSRIYLSSRYFKMYKSNKHTPIKPFWFNIFSLYIFLSGLTWGLSFILLTYENIPSEYHFFLASIMISLGGAAITTLGTRLSFYLLFTVPMLSIYIIWLVFQEDKLHIALAILILLILIFYYMTVKRYSNFFNESIKKRNEAIGTQREMIERLSKASELKDNETGMHIKRVSHFSYLLAKECTQDKILLENIYLASAMHDAGKLGIPDNILLKKGKFTTEEWIQMQKHTIIGKNLLEGSESKLIQLSESIAYTHHEKYNGTGYPRSLKGENIPIEGRIVAIADTYDALTSKRPYKEAWSNEQAFAYIEEKSGTSFDPELVKHFLNLKEKIVAYQNTHQD